MVDLTLHDRVDAETKRRVQEYVDANRTTCPTVTAFILAAVDEKLTRVEMDEPTRIAGILLDLLRSNEQFREGVRRELRDL